MLVRGADRAAERTTKSALDSSFGNFQLPTDPSALGQQYGQVAGNLLKNLDIPGAMDRSKTLAAENATTAAASMFENRVKTQELEKTPIADLDKEIARLSQQRWGILPAVLGRTDIIDYGAKLKIAAQAENIMDNEITRLTNSRQDIQTAAENRAKDKTDQLKAQAALIDKQSQAAKDDLAQRIDLFKAGTGTFDDIVQASLKLKELNDKKDKASAGDGNPFLGLPSAGAGQFSPEMISAFLYFEANNKFPVASSVGHQNEFVLTNLYNKWVSSGRPMGSTGGTQLPVNGPGIQLLSGAPAAPAILSGPLPSPAATDNPFSGPAASNTSKTQQMLHQFLGM